MNMLELQKRIYENGKLYLFLLRLCTLFSLLVALSFLATLICFFIQEEYQTLISVALFFSVGFILVSLTRKIIKANRPYEIYSFYVKKPRSKISDSFPSRHCYSAFAIATLTLPVSIYFSLAVFVLSFAIAVIRVFLGFHFIRDVVCGALIGALCGSVSLILL